MKTVKSKIQKNKAKKIARKQIEKTLTDKFLAAAGELGHNAELIAEDIARASKRIARKLAKGFKEAKEAVSNKIEDVTAKKPAKPATANKLPKEVKKVQKEVKKALAKVKPAVGSVMVKPIKTEKKAEKVLNPKVKAAVKPEVKPAPKSIAAKTSKAVKTTSASISKSTPAKK